MKPTLQPLLRLRPLLGFLLLVLIAVEIAPIVLFGHWRSIWAMNNFEDFDFMFWPPINVGYTPSFFYFHVGTVSWGLMKPVHGLVAAWLGTKHISLEYLQLFGYLTRSHYAGLMLMVPVVYWWRGRKHLAACLVVGFALALHLAAPYILHLYHMRVGPQLTYKLCALLLAVAVIDATDGFLKGSNPSYRRISLWGFVVGITFLEVPHYILLATPLFAISLVLFKDFFAAGKTIICWAAGGIAGFVAGLASFYGTDLRSGLAATFSLFRGLIVGFPQPQPGFKENFIDHLFQPKTNYFYIHTDLALQIVLVAVFGLALTLTWTVLSKRARFLALSTAGCFVLVWVAHMKIWSTRGSYTSVFSLIYFGFLLNAMIILQLVAFRDAVQSQGRRWLLLPLAFALSAFALPCVLTLRYYDIWGQYYQQIATGMAFRSFNEMTGRLPKPIGVVYNQHRNYYLLGAHYELAGFIFHEGQQGWNGEDKRYSDSIRQERHPDFTTFYPTRAKQVSYDFKHAAILISFEDGYPPADSLAVFIPVPFAFGRKAAPEAEAKSHLIPAGQIPAAIDLRQFLLSKPGYGITWEPPHDFPWAHWFIAPFEDLEARKIFLTENWPMNWNATQYAFYLVGTATGYYVLALKVPAEN